MACERDRVVMVGCVNSSRDSPHSLRETLNGIEGEVRRILASCECPNCAQIEIITREIDTCLLRSRHWMRADKTGISSSSIHDRLLDRANVGYHSRWFG